MSVPTDDAVPVRPAGGCAAGRLFTRVRAGAMAVVGAVSGVAPHVLHHAGPLAGAALLAGTGGTILFYVLGMIVSIPFLLRLYRRFASWTAPAVAVAVFTAAFAFSALVVGPAIRGGDSGSSTTTEVPGGHASHHR